MYGRDAPRGEFTRARGIHARARRTRARETTRMATANLPPRRRDGSSERSSVSTLNGRLADDVSDILSYSARSGGARGARASSRAIERGNARVELDRASSRSSGGRGVDYRLNAAYEPASGGEPRYDATSILQLLGDDGSERGDVVGAGGVTATKREGEPEGKSGVGASRAPRAVPEYDFVMLREDMTKKTPNAGAEAPARAADPLNENVNASEDGSPVQASVTGPPAKRTPWSSAVSDRLSDRGGNGNAPAQGERKDVRSSEGSAIRDSDSRDNSVRSSVEGTPIARDKLREQLIRDASEAAMVPLGQNRSTAQQRATQNRSLSIKNVDSPATRDTRRSAGSQGRGSMKLQYQQGSDDDVKSLLSHRQGNLLRTLGAWLNARLNLFTGFKVIPTFPLERRIERFIVGPGWRI